MKIEITMDDEAVETFAASLAKAMGGKPPKPPRAVKPKPEPEAEADAGEVDTGDEAETDTPTADGEADDFEGDAETTGPTRDAVLVALKAVSGNAALGQDKAMAILKKSGGVSKLSALDETKFAATIKACNDAVAAAKKK